MATEKPRFTITMDENLLDQIDDYKFTNRIKNQSKAIVELVQRGLIEECGRLDTPGKPLLYKTTAGFLKTFGLRQINDLPDIDNVPLQLTFYDMKEED